MSAITLDGTAFAAGLYWTRRGGRWKTIADARRYGRYRHVRLNGQTGYATEGAMPLAGLPSLAAALHRALTSESWVALLADDNQAQYAMVICRHGEILADGDTLYFDKPAALEAFERSRTYGFDLFAAPGLVENAGEIDAGRLHDEADIRLEAVALQWLRGPRLFVFLLLVVLAVIAGLAAWAYRDTLDGLIGTEAPAEPAPPAPRPEPMIAAAVDGQRLLEACVRALDDNPPVLLSWRIKRLSCIARLDDAELAAVTAQLQGRPALVVEWQGTARSGAEAVNRRLAERFLEDWPLAAVSNNAAWAIRPLPPVIVAYDRPAPAFLDFRRAVDQRLGAVATTLRYNRTGGAQAWSVEVVSPLGLRRLAAAMEGVEDLEILEARRNANGDWALTGRLAAPVSLKQSDFEALTSKEFYP